MAIREFNLLLLLVISLFNKVSSLIREHQENFVCLFVTATKKQFHTGLVKVVPLAKFNVR